MLPEHWRGPRVAESDATAASPSPIAVVIGTRLRPAGAFRAVASVLASSNPRLQLRVVDQSPTGETREALGPFAADPRMVYLRSTRAGIAVARNLGVAASTAPLIAFTDDDCEVDADWLNAITAPFLRESRIGVVLGSVIAAPYDRATGFTPAYRVPRPFVARSILSKARIEGIGACMAMSRSAWEALGGFDEQLGTGGPLRAGEETDLIMRALIRGVWVSETPAARVTHSGFRTWDEGRPLIEGYMHGLGAANAKMLRLAGTRALVPISALAWRWLVGGPAIDLNHRPPHLARLRSFLRGAVFGLRLSIDPRTGHFVPPPPPLAGISTPI